ncbi:MAG: amidohydrolase [Acidobacteriia bacterium]|nr:amidohydrolase [Terriglobia bacterium]
MLPFFEVKAADRDFYEQRLQSFLPDKLLDIHTHVWLTRFKSNLKDESVRAVTWPDLVAVDNSIEDLMETYRLMFPDKKVTPLIFGNTASFGDDLDGGNEYIRECAQKYRVPSLIFADPRWTEAEFEEKVSSGHFLGAKVYLSLSDPRIREEDIQIYDFLPHHQLKVLDRHGWIVMLHIPRRARLRDPLNLAQMVEIEKQYPNVRVIIAHVGRAYCPEDAGNAFEVLAETRRMCFDISANTCCETFGQLISAVGPKRILFGSDLPILRMRARRICEEGVYVNLVPRGMYGVVPSDPHMREVGNQDAEKLTFFMYEEIEAFRRAASKAGWGEEEIEDVFYGNAVRVLCEAGMPESLLTSGGALS